MESLGVACPVHPVAAAALSIMRSKHTPPPEFARQLHRLSLVLANDATAYVATRTTELVTPMGPCLGTALQGVHALVPIMRAGQGMVDAFRLMLPDAVLWHMSIARDEHTHLPLFKDSKVPKEIAGIDTCFVLDPMLATGGSASYAIAHLKQRGAKKIVFVGVIGCPQGIERIQADHGDVPIFLGAVDPELNQNAYIVPGLGDAGDRLYPTVPWHS